MAAICGAATVAKINLPPPSDLVPQRAAAARSHRHRCSCAASLLAVGCTECRPTPPCSEPPWGLACSCTVTRRASCRSFEVRRCDTQSACWQGLSCSFRAESGNAFSCLAALPRVDGSELSSPSCSLSTACLCRPVGAGYRCRAGRHGGLIRRRVGGASQRVL